MNTDKFIDVENLIASKNKKLAKLLPGFITRYLKRILHQDEINTFISNAKDLKDEDFCTEVIEKFKITVIIDGIDNVPTEGGAILAMNHPLGGMDAMAIVHALRGRRTDFRFIVNDLLLQLKNLNGIFLGVNKHGKNEKSFHHQMESLFASPHLIGVFPAGLVSRKKKGIIKDLEWKKTFVKYAKRYDKPVIPVHIEGELTPFFYRLSNFRSALGIKANLEMLYLSDELHRQKKKTIHITIGEPLDLKKFKEKDIEIAQQVKNIVYDLSKRK